MILSLNVTSPIWDLPLNRNFQVDLFATVLVFANYVDLRTQKVIQEQQYKQIIGSVLKCPQSYREDSQSNT